ncbi:MAG: tetratricopeptide repeat protein [bacterium]
MTRPEFRSLLFGALVVCVTVWSPVRTASAAAAAEDLQRLLSETQGADRIPLLLQLAERSAGEPTRVLELTGEALALLATSRSDSLEIVARGLRSDALVNRSETEDALVEARRAEAVARDSGREDLLGEALFRVAFVQWRTGEHSEALATAQTARRLQEPTGPSHGLFRTLSLLGAIHWSRSALDRALEFDLAAREMVEGLGDEQAVARCDNNIGLIYWDLGRNEEAFQYLSRALEVCERGEDRFNLKNILNNIGLVLIELDRPAEGASYLERAYRHCVETDDLYGQGKALSNLGFAQEKLGNSAQALELHERALAVRRQIDDKEGIVRSSDALAEVHLARGDAGEALGLLEPALALAAAIEARRDQADLLDTLAEARAATGDAAGALEAYREARAIEEDLDSDTTRQKIADLEKQLRAADQAREVAAIQAIADSRRDKVRWLAVGIGFLLLCLLLLTAAFLIRLRSQRAVAESELRYRALFRASVVPTFLIEGEGRRVLDLNEPARRLCGVAFGTEPIERESIEPEWLRSALQRLFASGSTDPLALDDEVIEPSGKRRCSELRASSVTVGGRRCHLVTVRDTTESRMLEEARLREGKLESLGIMAGGIAHDFNNALAGIIGHVSLARDGNPAERERLLSLAEAAASGARRLTGQLLAFAKGGEPVRRVANVGRLLRESVELATAGSKLQTVLEVPEDLWAASLDEAQFGQVVSNLVINAEQATGEEGRLVIRASNFRGDPQTGEAASGERFVRIEFADNGCGVSPDVRERLFDPYFTTKSQGSGLGLATAHTICVRHGGALTLGPSSGPGASFSVFLPATTEVSAPPEEGAVPPDWSGGRVLVLEDEPLLQNLLVSILGRWGFEVDVVADGRDAVQRYAERRGNGSAYDLLIMDLTIRGGMGGTEAIAEIRAHDPDARAVVVSGYSDDPTMAHFREAGFVAALAKPFEFDELARAVGVAMARVGTGSGNC